MRTPVCVPPHCPRGNMAFPASFRERIGKRLQMQNAQLRMRGTRTSSENSFKGIGEGIATRHLSQVTDFRDETASFRVLFCLRSENVRRRPIPSRKTLLCSNLGAPFQARLTARCVNSDTRLTGLYWDFAGCPLWSVFNRTADITQRLGPLARGMTGQIRMHGGRKSAATPGLSLAQVKAGCGSPWRRRDTDG